MGGRGVAWLYQYLHPKKFYKSGYMTLTAAKTLGITISVGDTAIPKISKNPILLTLLVVL